jgi:hypothetical protein
MVQEVDIPDVAGAHRRRAFWRDFTENLDTFLKKERDEVVLTGDYSLLSTILSINRWSKEMELPYHAFQKNGSAHVRYIREWDKYS